MQEGGCLDLGRGSSDQAGRGVERGEGGEGGVRVASGASPRRPLRPQAQAPWGAAHDWEYRDPIKHTTPRLDSAAPQ